MGDWSELSRREGGNVKMAVLTLKGNERNSTSTRTLNA